jgi:hypothetical protein
MFFLDEPQKTHRQVLELITVITEGSSGPTMTHAVAETSLALEAGDPAGCVGEDGEPLASDQRGATRPVGVCDIGAVEMQRP